MGYNFKETMSKPERLAPGHRMCAGCGGTIAVRNVLRGLHEGDKAVIGNATGCLEVSTFTYPYTAWEDSYIHNAFENAGATLSGVEGAYKALKRKGKLAEDYKFITFGGDGGTYDIGFQSLSGAMERNHDMVYVCYDNGAYMNTGIQRSSATPMYADTTTTPVGSESNGKPQNRKDLASVIAAHDVPYVAQTMHDWNYDSNPLLVPEARRDAVTASYAMYAMIHHHALCYSPFGIEDLGLEPEALPTPPPEMMAALNIDPASFDIHGTKAALGSVYALLEEMRPLYLKYRGTRHMQCFLKHSEEDKGDYLRFQNFDIEISYFPKAPGCPLSAGVIYELSESKFLIAGMMAQFTFHPKAGENKNVGFLRKESGTVRDGRWETWQIQNGDENGHMMAVNQPTCFYFEMYKY